MIDGELIYGGRRNARTASLRSRLVDALDEQGAALLVYRRPSGERYAKVWRDGRLVSDAPVGATIGPPHLAPARAPEAPPPASPPVDTVETPE